MTGAYSEIRLGGNIGVREGKNNNPHGARIAPPPKKKITLEMSKYGRDFTIFDFPSLLLFLSHFSLFHHYFVPFFISLFQNSWGVGHLPTLPTLPPEMMHLLLAYTYIL